MIKLIQGIVDSGMKRFLLTAFLVTLATTGSLFAYAYTIASTSLTVASGANDFASVSANKTVPSYTVFGNYRGRIQPGNLFNVIPTSGYPGDLEVNVYLTNIDELSYNYGFFLMRIQLVNGTGQYMDVEGIDKPITLSNGEVSFVSSNMTAGSTYYIKTTGGVYRAFPWAYLTGQSIYSPSLTAEVLQAGL